MIIPLYSWRSKVVLRPKGIGTLSLATFVTGGGGGGAEVEEAAEMRAMADELDVFGE